MKIFIITIFALGILSGIIFWYRDTLLPPKITLQNQDSGGPTEEFNPLAIEAMRKHEYPGSDIVIEQTLAPGVQYNKYIASYKSDGLKIFALFTVPSGEPPVGGWPAIIFNHGYIPPEQYQATERYVAYQDGFARNGYVTFKSDYRGHGNSEGKPEGAYYSPAYTADVLNAVSSIKKYPDVNREKIGMWGHSLGGHITLKTMVISKEIKVGVIWAGVVASHADMIQNWHRRTPWNPSAKEQTSNRPNRQRFIDQYGTPEQKPEFWNSISPISYVEDISGPVQIHHGTADETVPITFSESLNVALETAGKNVEYFIYDGADHNLSGNAFGLAMRRSIEFFDRYLHPQTVQRE